MRNIQPPVPRIAIHWRRIPPIFVEWTAIMLILLTVTLCTFSGNFQSISWAAPQYTAGSSSFTSLTPGVGCIQILVPVTYNPTGSVVNNQCTTTGSQPCIAFDPVTGLCGFPPQGQNLDSRVGGCLVWWSSPSSNDWCYTWSTTIAPNGNACRHFILLLRRMHNERSKLCRLGSIIIQR